MSLTPSEPTSPSSERDRPIDRDTALNIAATTPVATNFQTLTRLFSREYAAPIDIRSNDKTLLFNDGRNHYDPPFLPEPLKQIPEGYFIWRETFHPSQNRAQILARQCMIHDFSTRADLEKLAEIKNVIYEFKTALEHGFFATIKVDDHRHMTALSLFKLGPNGRNGDFFSFAQGCIEKGTRILLKVKSAMRELAELLRNPAGTNLVILGDELKKLVQESCDVTPERIINELCSESRARSLCTKIMESNIRIGAMLELGSLLSKGVLNRGTFDANAPIQYKNGWNISLPETRQHTNDSPDDKPVIDFCGSNMSGKSESGLKQVHFVQRLMQTWGVSTIKSGNFRIYDDFFYFDRAATEHRNGLSAFGDEVGFYRTHYPTLGECPFGCVDEGFSTTDREGQYRLLTGVKSVKRIGRGKIHFSNHNEEFNDAVSRFPDSAVYHFATVTDATGITTFTYKMTPGVADSNSIAVADALNSDPELRRRTKLARDGSVPISDKPGELKYYVVNKYDEDARARSKSLVPESLFLAPPEKKRHGAIGFEIKKEESSKESRNFVSLISIDKELTDSALPLADSTENIKRWTMVGGRYFTGSGSARDLKELFLQGERPSPEETLERQRTFIALADNDRYEEFAKLNSTLMQTLSFAPMAGAVASDLFSANRALDPFKYGGLDIDGGSQYRSAEAAILFLRLNQRLLGEQFIHTELLDQIALAHKTALSERGRIEAMTIEELAATIDVQRKASVDPKMQRRARVFARMSGVALTPEALASIGGFAKWVEDIRHSDVPYELRRRRTFDEMVNYSTTCFKEIRCDEFYAWYQPWVNELKLKAIAPTLANLRALRENYEHSAPRELYDWISNLSTVVSQAIPAVVPTNFPDYSEGTKASRLNEIEDQMRKITYEVKIDRFSETLPPVPWDAFSKEAIEQEVLPLANILKQHYKQTKLDEHHDWPTALQVALVLEINCRPANIYQDIDVLLRSYDSVHTHQAANALAEELKQASIPRMERWGGEDSFHNPMLAKFYLTGRDSGPFLKAMTSEARIAEVEAALGRKDMGPFHQLIKDVALDDPRKVLPRMREYFDRNFSKLWDDLNALEAQKRKLDASFGVLADRQRCEQILSIAAGALHDRGKMYQACRAFSEIAKGEAPKLDDFLPENDFDNYATHLARYRELYIANSPLIDNARAALKAINELRDAVDAFFSNHRLFRENREENSVSSARYRARSWINHNLGWISPLRHNSVAEAQRIAQHTANMFLWGHTISARRYGAVNFKREGVIEFNGLSSLFADETHVTQDLRWDHSSGVVLITGPNMSGKTTLLKKVLLGVGCAHQTGFAPSTSSSMPFMRRAIYIDRVTGKQERNLSSMGSELKRTDQVLADIRTGEPVLLLSDEAFSTMSARYQGWFSTGFLSEVHDLGQFAIFASHHHDSVDVMSRASSYFVPIHLHYEVDSKEDKINFSYLPTAGHAPSEAIKVARTYKMPEEILVGAENAP